MNAVRSLRVLLRPVEFRLSDEFGDDVDDDDRLYDEFLLSLSLLGFVFDNKLFGSPKDS